MADTTLTGQLLGGVDWFSKQLLGDSFVVRELTIQGWAGPVC